MMAEESSCFPKQIKLDDYGEFAEGNLIRLIESSNLLLGSGARTSPAAIVLAKTLHYQFQQGVFPLKGLTFLDLGCGAGFLGIYLCCLGANVIMADVPSIRDLTERNISLNKSLFQGKLEIITANWYQSEYKRRKQECVGKCEEMSSQSSASSEHREECLLHLMPKINYTVVVEGGGLHDLQLQLRWMGKEGMIVCFLERQYSNPQDYLSSRVLQEYLIEKDINYQKVQGYHPDYHDERVQIYKLSR